MRLRIVSALLALWADQTVLAQDLRPFEIKEDYLQSTIAYRRQLASWLMSQNDDTGSVTYQGTLTPLMVQLRLKVPRRTVIEVATLTIDDAQIKSVPMALKRFSPMSWHSFDLGEVPVGLRLLAVKLLMRMPQGFAPFGASPQRREVSGVVPVTVLAEQNEIQIGATLSDHGFFAAAPLLELGVIESRE
jgi:hypothetical protein